MFLNPFHSLFSIALGCGVDSDGDGGVTYDTDKPYSVIRIPTNAVIIIDVDHTDRADLPPAALEWADAIIETDHGVQLIRVEPTPEDMKVEGTAVSYPAYPDIGALQDRWFQTISCGHGTWSLRTHNKENDDPRKAEVLKERGQDFCSFFNSMVREAPGNKLEWLTRIKGYEHLDIGRPIPEDEVATE